MKKKDGLVGTVWGIEINHTYNIGSNGKPNIHTCLDYGFWCWQHVKERPQNIIKYLRYKRKHR